jgi:probable phosphoglycerate mutase
MPSEDRAGAAPVACAIVFDGGSLGNPGRGYGSYRLRMGTGPWSEPVRLEHGARVTSNEAEYRTLSAGLADLAARLPDPARANVEVRGDSKLVIEQLAGRWKVRAPNLAADHARARALLGRFGQVRLVWQPRAESVALLGH